MALHNTRKDHKSQGQSVLALIFMVFPLYFAMYLLLQQLHHVKIRYLTVGIYLCRNAILVLHICAVCMRHVLTCRKAYAILVLSVAHLLLVDGIVAYSTPVH